MIGQFRSVVVFGSFVVLLVNQPSSLSLLKNLVQLVKDFVNSQLIMSRA